MKKKWSPKNIVLLVLVLGVWTYMGLRAFDYFEGEEQVENEGTSQDVVVSEQNNPRKKGYTLMDEAYRDPFLGKTSQSGKRQYRSNSSVSHNTTDSKRDTRKNTSKNDKKTEEPVETPWPSITFKGTIENAKNKQAVAVVVINGVEDFYSVGQSYQQVTVLGFSENEVSVKFNEETRVIGK